MIVSDMTRGEGRELWYPWSWLTWELTPLEVEKSTMTLIFKEGEMPGEDYAVPIGWRQKAKVGTVFGPCNYNDVQLIELSKSVNQGGRSKYCRCLIYLWEGLSKSCKFRQMCGTSGLLNNQALGCKHPWRNSLIQKLFAHFHPDSFSSGRFLTFRKMLLRPWVAIWVSCGPAGCSNILQVRIGFSDLVPKFTFLCWQGWWGSSCTFPRWTQTQPSTLPRFC